MSPNFNLSPFPYELPRSLFYTVTAEYISMFNGMFGFLSKCLSCVLYPRAVWLSQPEAPPFFIPRGWILHGQDWPPRVTDEVTGSPRARRSFGGILRSHARKCATRALGMDQGHQSPVTNPQLSSPEQVLYRRATGSVDVESHHTQQMSK